jgi:hypothetical protein
MPVLLVRHWKLIAMGLLAVAFALQTLRANHYAAKAETCAIARKNDRKAYELASKEAEARAVAQKQAVEASYRAKAERTDDDYQTALSRAQRASDAYARRMRAQVSGGASGSTPASSPSDGPEGPDRSGSDAVVVTRDDFDILVENSVRLEAAHQWAKTLAEPIPDPAFGQ